MILISDNLEPIRRYCEEHREDVGSSQPYFLEQQHADGWLLPEDELVEEAISELGVSYQFLIIHRGKEIVIEP